MTDAFADLVAADPVTGVGYVVSHELRESAAADHVRCPAPAKNDRLLAKLREVAGAPLSKEASGVAPPESQLVMVGYRDRIVTIDHDRTEAGLNRLTANAPSPRPVLRLVPSDWTEEPTLAVDPRSDGGTVTQASGLVEPPPR